MATHENLNKTLQLISSSTEAATSSWDDYDVQLLIFKMTSAFMWLIFLVGFLGNILVIVVVWANPHLKTTTNLMIQNLAASNLLFIIVGIPIIAMDYLEYNLFGEFGCKFMEFLSLVTITMNVYIVVMMCFERFLAVVFPTRSMEFRTKYNFGYFLNALWMTTFISSMLVFYYQEFKRAFTHEDIKVLSCSYLQREVLSQDPNIKPYFVFTYLMPLATCTVFLLTILLKHCISGSIGKLSQCNSQNEEGRVTRLVFVVALVFFILSGPDQVCKVLESFEYYTIDSQVELAMRIFAQLLHNCTLCVNPLLYVLMSDSFRNAFKNVICGLNFKKRIDPFFGRINP